MNFVTSNDLHQRLSSGEIIVDEIRELLDENFEALSYDIFPEIYRTGTAYDEEEPLFKKPEKKNAKVHIDPLNINSFLGFELLPSLIQLFCLTQNEGLETKILSLCIRLYNQRLELVQNATKMLLLFDDVNIKIFNLCRRKLRRLAKLCNDSEVNSQS
jgi:hypothetical protein